MYTFKLKNILQNVCRHSCHVDAAALCIVIIQFCVVDIEMSIYIKHNLFFITCGEQAAAQPHKPRCRLGICFQMHSLIRFILLWNKFAEKLRKITSSRVRDFILPTWCGPWEKNKLYIPMYLWCAREKFPFILFTTHKKNAVWKYWFLFIHIAHICRRVSGGARHRMVQFSKYIHYINSFCIHIIDTVLMIDDFSYIHIQAKKKFEWIFERIFFCC